MGKDAQKFTVILEQDDRGLYAVHCPAVQCSSQGHDRAEALAMIAELIQIMLDIYDEDKESNLALIPLPMAETPELIADEVRQILDFRVEYELPMDLEIVQVAIPAPVAV